jgi:hypothetical protein
MSFLSAERVIDIERLRHLCDRFYSEMTCNRRGFDDGGLARKVMRDIERYGTLTRTTEKRLRAWCYTGAMFERGVLLAREISIAIFGYVLPRD